MIRIGIERPSNENIIDFMIMKLIEIANKLDSERTSIMKIEFYNCIRVDGIRMLKRLSTKLKIPLIECHYADDKDAVVVVVAADEEERKNKQELCNLHTLICEFKETDSTKKFMRITPNYNDNNAMAHECSDINKKPNTIDMELRYDNLKNLIRNVRIVSGKSYKFRANIVEWNRRVLIVGRIGSGRRTQASLLAKEFGLVLIDFDPTIMEYEQQQQQPSNKEQQCDMSFWGYAQELVLKPDCLRNGYVIVSNVISRPKLEILMEKFIHAPNQIIFIHTCENKCRRRILRCHKGIFSSYRGLLPHRRHNQQPTISIIT